MLIIGIAIGEVMYGWILADVLAQYAGRNNPFAVVVAVLIGVSHDFYSSDFVHKSMKIFFDMLHTS